jgi:hypothetical protein
MNIVYEVRPRRDGRVDIISDALPLRCAVWHSQPNAINDAVEYAKFHSRSHDAVIRVYDEAGNVIEAREQQASSR